MDGDTFAGSVKVKLGPIALVYNGSGTFVEKDDAAHRFVVDAKGKDKRGNGTAGAKVTLSMAESGTSTDVEVLTDLAITGKPAQFGRGVMQDVSDKLLGQFVACLEQRLTGPGPAAPVEGGAAGEVEEAAAPADPEEAVTSDTAAATDAVPPAGRRLRRLRRLPPPRRAPAARPSPPPSPAPAQDSSLNLGTTVLPILLKAYWKPIVGVLVLLALVIWWFAATRLIA